MIKRFRTLFAIITGLVFMLTVNPVSAQTVYICKSKSGKVYHKTANCSALKKCKAGTTRLSLTSAKSLKKRQCRICFKRSGKRKSKAKNRNRSRKDKNKPKKRR